MKYFRHVINSNYQLNISFTILLMFMIIVNVKGQCDDIEHVKMSNSQLVVYEYFIKALKNYEEYLANSSKKDKYCVDTNKMIFMEMSIESDSVINFVLTYHKSINTFLRKKSFKYSIIDNNILIHYTSDFHYNNCNPECIIEMSKIVNSFCSERGIIKDWENYIFNMNESTVYFYDPLRLKFKLVNGKIKTVEFWKEEMYSAERLSPC